MIEQDFHERLAALTPTQRGMLARRIAAGRPESAANASSLAAFIVPQPSQQIDVEQLRTHLAGQLPEYMVPARFVAVDSFPLTPNGKVDRRALLAHQASPGEKPAEAPRNDLEAALQKIWQEVLDRRRVGIHDNFFHIGGHSLLITILVSRIRDTFQQEISLRSIFETPTIARLAARLQEAAAEPAVLMETATLYLQLAELSDEELAALSDEKTTDGEAQ